jgi:hypothetical protein
MPQYLLPCSCGEKVRVEPAQAGGLVACTCGQSLTVPTLRGLRALEEAPADVANLRGGRRWGPVQGALFSIGLVVTVVALAVVTYTFVLFLDASQYTRDMSPEVNEFSGMQIDQMTAMEVYDEFVALRSEGLGEIGVLPWVHFQRVVAEQRILMISSGIAAAIGLFAVMGSLLLKPAPPRA